MSDLIKHGRVWADQLDCADVPLVNALCDEIERLQAQVKALEAAWPLAREMTASKDGLDYTYLTLEETLEAAKELESCEID